MNIKYLRDGRQVEVVYQNEKDNVVFVCPIVDWIEEYEHDEPVHGPIERVDKVYDVPQMYQFHQQVTSIKSTIHDLDKQLEQKKRELGQTKADIRDMVRKKEALLKRVPYLDRIEAFFDDKITHVVEIENKYAVIKEINDYDEEHGKRYTAKFRMFALVGDRVRQDKGIRWAVNEYREGSGFYCDCIPCLSYEEAKEIAFEHTMKNIKKIGDGYLLSLAKNHGFKIPDDRKKAIEENEREEKAKKLKKKQEELEQLKTTVRLLEDQVGASAE